MKTYYKTNVNEMLVFENYLIIINIQIIMIIYIKETS